MHLRFKNVNDAFRGLVASIQQGDITYRVQPSRNGETLQVDEPMTVTYLFPRNRVLFNYTRDCNPFFHLFESLWMLAGCNDIEPLTYFLPAYKNFSDDGKTANGAYGYRWRSAQVPDEQNWVNGDGCDQLAVLAEHLKKNPYSRRAVLQMWNVEDDLLKIDSSKDVCCNTAAYFLIESGDCPQCNGKGYECDEATGPLRCLKCKGEPHEQPRYLNMTVTNRSNDLIWGMLGANAVHFSFLQEYMAARIGLDVGSYNQFTNNLHVYTETNSGWHPKEWLAEYGETPWDDETVYDQESFQNFPLVNNVETFDKEVREFVRQWRDIRVWQEPFLEFVAKPLMRAFQLHKDRRYDAALDAVSLCYAEDWKVAARTWIVRRRNAWEEKQTNV